MDSNMYYSSMCHTCKKISADLKTCSSCKTLSYCSKEHQVKDWPNHKELCKIIKKTRSTCTIKSKLTWDEWVVHRTRIKSVWKSLLHRNFHLYESQMWMFPKACAVCYSSEPKVDCDFCLNVFYCTLEHKNEHLEQHKEYCKSLRIGMEVDHYLFTNNYIPTVKFYKVDDSLQHLPENIMQLLNHVEIKLYPSIANKAIEFVRLADFLAPVATLLYTLEKICVIDNRKMDADSLTIHIVGAGKLENHLDWIVYLEFICHWIKTLKIIKVMLIGPELTQHHLFGNIACTFCDDCMINRKVEAYLECYADLYHNVVNSLPHADFMLSYNSGLHEFENKDGDTWKDSIQLLMCNEAPFILTSYTLCEMLKDLNRLQSIDGGNVLLSPHRNPFMCCRPYRDWETKDQPVFYDNAWLCVVNK